MTTGALTAIAGSPFATGTGPGTLSIDSNGDFAYLANHGSGSVSAFTINATTGALIAVAGSPFATGANPYSVTLPIDSFNPWAY
jgi:VCBS repeat-containing protein